MESDVCVEYDGGVVAMLARSKMASLLRCGWRGGAVVEWWLNGGLTKIKKVKEKRLSKDHSHLNHMYSH